MLNQQSQASLEGVMPPVQVTIQPATKPPQRVSQSSRDPSSQKLSGETNLMSSKEGNPGFESDPLSRPSLVKLNSLPSSIPNIYLNASAYSSISDFQSSINSGKNSVASQMESDYAKGEFEDFIAMPEQTFLRQSILKSDQIPKSLFPVCKTF